MSYKYLSAGYCVSDGKVFLSHHVKFDKWTPPGGKIEENETPDETVVREWKEELGLDVSVVPAHESAFAGDSNATVIPMPFHIDLEREDFKESHVGFFFFVQLQNPDQAMKVLKDELHDAQWFSKEDLSELKTFEQVRALAEYAIDNHPNGGTVTH